MSITVRALPKLSSFLLASMVSMIIPIGIIIFCIYFFRRIFKSMKDIEKIRENTDEIIKNINMNK